MEFCAWVSHVVDGRGNSSEQGSSRGNPLLVTGRRVQDIAAGEVGPVFFLGLSSESPLGICVEGETTARVSRHRLEEECKQTPSFSPFLRVSSTW